MAKELAESEYAHFHLNRLRIEARRANEEDFELLAKLIEGKGKALKSRLTKCNRGSLKNR